MVTLGLLASTSSHAQVVPQSNPTAGRTTLSVADSSAATAFKSANRPNATEPPDELTSSYVDSLQIRPEPRGGRPSPAEIRQMLRPRVAFSSEWQTASDFDLNTFDFSVSLATYPFWGPPPPTVSVGLNYTDLNDSQSLGLPADLYQFSTGVSWVRPVNERWMVRSMAGIAIATDLDSFEDAWQFRGGLFAVYEPNEHWQWVFGAIALGRRDLPVVPALGVVWRPTPDWRVDMTLPKPRVSRLLAENNRRQQWGYLGMGLTGGTWAFRRPDQTNDLLTYGDWRVVAGWESLPTPKAGERFTMGRKLNFEFGYAFSRDLEFREGPTSISLEDAILFGFSTRF